MKRIDHEDLLKIARAGRAAIGHRNFVGKVIILPDGRRFERRGAMDQFREVRVDPKSSGSTKS